MKVLGARKFVIALVIGVIAATVPLTDNQADVLMALTYATMGANSLEHIGGAIVARRTAAAGDSRSRDCSPAGSAVEDQE